MSTTRIHSSSIGAPGAWALALALAAAGQPAAAASGDDVERAAIAQERMAIESRYAARERECNTRFVVTACVDEAKGERRHGIDALRARQLKLDEARRRERTDARRDELAGKAVEDARREQARVVRPAPAAQAPGPIEPRHDSPSSGARGSTPHPGSDRPHAGDGLGSKPQRRETAAERQGRETRHRASFETRQRQAAEHREGIDAKAAERSKQHAPAAPLPIPASAPVS